MSVDLYYDTTRLDTILRNLDPRADAQLNDAGEDLENIIKGVVTEMDVVDSGQLRDSVKWKPTPSASGVHHGVVEVSAKSDRGFPYPIAQHEGWTDRAGNWHPGRPFVRVGVERFKPYFRTNYFGRLFD